MYLMLYRSVIYLTNCNVFYIFIALNDEGKGSIKHDQRTRNEFLNNHIIPK